MSLVPMRAILEATEKYKTAAEMIEMVNDGSMKALYKSQQNGFIASGAVEGEVPVENYVMFDLMLKAYK